MTNILGISAGFHDAAISVIDRKGDILFAGHSERYSGIKNDPTVDPELVHEANQLGYNHVAVYERPWMHNIQKLYSGQRPFAPWTTRGFIRKHLKQSNFSFSTSSHSHHLSHAAAGFQTSPFSEAAVVVIDAIGELDTISIYHASYDSKGRARYQCRWRQRYPHSIGLFYSAITKSVGLKPQEDEYITMGMAAYGTDSGQAHLEQAVVADADEIRFKQNLHIGFDDDEWKNVKPENLAAAAQSTVEKLIMTVMRRAKELVPSNNLVYMGGVALNCVANTRLEQLYDCVWIMPNPGDAGSSLGAAALVYEKQLNWHDAYLGHNIKGDYPVEEVLQELLTTGIVGVASGRAEFGPRALGNRSLLADPRGSDIKDRVNEIKRRQKFRPFAPIVLEEHYSENFKGPANPYMQFTSCCTNRDLYPAICHVDGTSRVQTVPNDNSGVRQLLEAWYAQTGCPMLLNTSLNIRGEPMVNNRSDADRFEKLYNVRVFS